MSISPLLGQASGLGRTSFLFLLAAVLCGSFALSAVATPLLARLFRRLGFADEPRRDRHSRRKVPKGGGVAIFWAVALPVLAGLVLAKYFLAHPDLLAPIPGDLEQHLPGIMQKAAGALAILAGAAVLHVLGLIDDYRPVSPLVKLIVQFAVAICLVWFFEIRLLTFLPLHIGTMLTVIWIVLLTNAFNFLDNMDGLSAGVAAIVLVMFVWVGRSSQQIFVPTMAAVLLGALLGFLLYNFSPAKIFMGDSGSLPLGYLLGVVSVLMTYYNPEVHQGQWYSALAPLVIFAIPLYDFVSVVFLRLRAGQAPWIGDRRHFSHRLIQGGMSESKAVLTIYLATATTAVSASFLSGVGAFAAVLIFVQTLAVTGIIALLESAWQVQTTETQSNDEQNPDDTET